MAALDSVVRKYSHYKNVLDPYVEKIYKKFDNNSEVITGIAKAYYSFSRPEGQMYYTFVTRDSANAYKYINLAIANDRSYVPAYIHGGDIQLTMGNRDAALDWYRRAMQPTSLCPTATCLTSTWHSMPILLRLFRPCRPFATACPLTLWSWLLPGPTSGGLT